MTLTGLLLVTLPNVYYPIASAQKMVPLYQVIYLPEKYLK